MDWNNDGKHDGKDYDIYNNLINSQSDNRSGNSRGTSSHTSVGVITFVALISLYAILSGFVPINTFTALVAVICVAVVAYGVFS